MHDETFVGDPVYESRDYWW